MQENPVDARAEIRSIMQELSDSLDQDLSSRITQP